MPQSQQSDDELTRLLFVALAGCLVAATVLSAIESEVRPWLTLVAWLHLVPAAMLAEGIPALQSVALLGNKLLVPALYAESLASPSSAAVIDRSQLLFVQQTAGRVAAILYMPPLLFLALRARRVRPDLRYRTTHDLDSLIHAQTMRWKAARTARVSPGDSPRACEPDNCSLRNDSHSGAGNLGLLIAPSPGNRCRSASERSLRPEEWLFHTRLVARNPCAPTNSRPTAQIANSELDAVCSHLDVEAVSEVLEDQLGPPWQGFEMLNSYERAIAAAFVCHFDFRPGTGEVILDNLAFVAERCRNRMERFPARVAKSVVLNRMIMSELHSDPGDQLRDIANQHAWQSTAFISMLSHARKNRGVLPSASFSWLKLMDRTLWFALNNAGNEAIMAEAAGVHAHYRAERQFGCALGCPRVFQASRALLEEYLDQIPSHTERRRTLASLRKPVAASLREGMLAENSGRFEDSTSRNRG